jgi:hypothetical protein
MSISIENLLASESKRSSAVPTPKTKRDFLPSEAVKQRKCLDYFFNEAFAKRLTAGFAVWRVACELMNSSDRKPSDQMR